MATTEYTSPWARASRDMPDRAPVTEDLNLYDHTASRPHYERLARLFADAAEAALDRGRDACSYEAVGAADAHYEVNENLMDMAYHLAEGHELRAVVERIHGRHHIFNAQGIAMAAPDLAENGTAPAPRIVIAKTEAAQKYMERHAYERMLRLVDIYDASLMHKREDFPAAQSFQGELYYNPRKDALDEARAELKRNISWLVRHDPAVRPLTKQDYAPL